MEAFCLFFPVSSFGEPHSPLPHVIRQLAPRQGVRRVFSSVVAFARPVLLGVWTFVFAFLLLRHQRVLFLKRGRRQFCR